MTEDVSDLGRIIVRRQAVAQQSSRDVEVHIDGRVVGSQHKTDQHVVEADEGVHTVSVGSGRDEQEVRFFLGGGGFVEVAITIASGIPAKAWTPGVSVERVGGTSRFRA